MADNMIQDLGINANIDLSSTAHSLSTFFVWVFILAVIFILFIYIWKILQYKHRFVIREVTNGIFRIKEDKARIIKDKADGIEKWRLLKFKKFAPQPPTEAISLTSKGNFHVEAKYSEDKGFEYILSNNLNSQESSDKLTTNQKIFLSNEFKKAELDKPRSIHETIAMMLPYGALLMFIIFGIIIISSWEDITKPLVQTAQTNAQVTKSLENIMNTQKDIIFRIQTIEGEKQSTPEGNS